MLRLYMDVHVKAAITAGLRRRGIDVVTAQEDGGTRLEETALQRLLFSQDDDWLGMARARQARGVFFAGLIDGHQLAATVGPDGLALDAVGQVLNPEDLAKRIASLPLTSVARARAGRHRARVVRHRSCCSAREGRDRHLMLRWWPTAGDVTRWLT